KNIYFYYKPTNDIENTLNPVFELARKNGFTIVNHPEDASIITSIGGDGMFLQAVRHTNFRQDCLYVGITRANESGLYCDFDMDNFDEMLHTIENAQLEVRKFPLITAQINNKDPFHCLNEVSLRSVITKTIVIDVHIDDHYFETF